MATGFLPIISAVPFSWTPAKVPTALWLDAADASTITLNNLTVSQWSDKSGNQRHVLQSTAANQPLYIKGQNTILWSEQLQQASWGTNAATISTDQIIAPDGTITADKLIDNTTNTAHYVAQNVAVVASTVYTLSAYIKAGERNFCGVQLGGSGFGNQGIAVNLTTGQTQFYNSGSIGSAVYAGNGWWRISITATATGSAGTPLISVDSALGNQFYAGTGTSGIYIWGVQLNVGSVAEPYQRTEGTALSVLSLNNRPNIVFDGVNDMLKSSANMGISGTQTFSLFAVHAFPWVSTKVATSFGGATRYHHMSSTTSNQYLTGYDGGTQVGTYTPSNPSTAYMLGIERTGNTGARWNVYQNGTALSVTAGNNNAVNLDNGPISVGSYIDGMLSASMNYNELIITNTVLSLSERQKIEGYLAWKWGLQSSLPVSHPYRLTQPIA